MSSGSQKALKGLAGAIALAGSTSAYAAIQPLNLPADVPSPAPPGTGGPVNWDIVGTPAGNDYTFNFRFPNSTGTTGVVWQANMNPLSATGAAVIGYQGPFINYATNLSPGQTVGPVPPAGASFRGQAQVTLGSIYRSGGVPSEYGGFAPGTPNPGGTAPGNTRGFVGFRFGSGVNTRYGYLELQVGPGIGIDFISGFYEDTGAPITIPEPTSLAALALGATAVLARRKKVA